MDNVAAVVNESDKFNCKIEEYFRCFSHSLVVTVRSHTVPFVMSIKCCTLYNEKLYADYKMQRESSDDCYHFLWTI